MGKTIIQTIGPLYGEVVNGTVFGRPNGSIYVPSSNTIRQSVPEDYRYVKLNTQGNRLIICDSTGKIYTTYPEAVLSVVAESQDMQNSIEIQTYTDSALTDLLAIRRINAGLFNIAYAQFGNIDGETIEANATYYVRSVLKSANGDPVAVSEVIALTGVVEE